MAAPNFLRCHGKILFKWHFYFHNHPFFGSKREARTSISKCPFFVLSWKQSQIWSCPQDILELIVHFFLIIKETFFASLSFCQFLYKSIHISLKIYMRIMLFLYKPITHLLKPKKTSARKQKKRNTNRSKKHIAFPDYSS